MYETTTTRQPAITFTDADYARVRALMRDATDYLLRELQANRDVTKATLAVNAACRAVETICDYGTTEGGR